MGIVSQVNEVFLKAKQTGKPFYLENFEFERGLGIIEDAFLVTIKSEDCLVIFQIFTNLRFIKNNSILLRYQDLFLKKNWKPITKKEYRAQKEIESTLLSDRLELVNEKYIGKEVKSIKLTDYGDLYISFGSSGCIQAFDDLDVRNGCRELYELIVVKNNEMTGFSLQEKKGKLILKETKECELIPERKNVGKRFLLKHID